MVYNYAKASETEGALEPLLQHLGKRFPKSRRKTSEGTIWVRSGFNGM